MHKKVDVVIIGAGPAGVAGAVYCARKGLKTLVIADTLGGQVGQTVVIENMLGQEAIAGAHLVKALENQLKIYDVAVKSPEKVMKITPKSGDFAVKLASGDEISAKAIIIATGAKWRKLAAKGADTYFQKGVAFCPHCDAPLFKNKNVCVIGGGNAGLESALDLANIAKSVVLFDAAPALSGDMILQNALKKLKNVKIILNAHIDEIVGNGKKATGITYHTNDNLSPQTIEMNGIFVQIGMIPHTKWLENLVALNEKGEIIINDKAATNIPGIFAAGDATSTPYKQIIIAAGCGATAGISAFNYIASNKSASAGDMA